MTPGPGRPKSDNPRIHAVPIRLSETELTIIRTAAEQAGVSVGAYIRSTVLRIAKRKS